MNTKEHKDRQGAIAEVVTALTKAVRNELDRATRTCLNCQNFDEKSELCKFNSYNQRPPARVIVTGCPSHEDEIPF
jgi:recombinational DNA repair protein RecR